MADPVVHITNGVPDTGTGTITTLGQTLLDGANATLGAIADITHAAGAAGSITSHLRTISRDIAGGVVLQAGGNTIGAVNQAGAPWSISGSVSVTGTVTVTGTVAATQSGTWNINNISGTISLPAGAATSAKQPALGTAGVPSSDVLTVQGAASMVALKVDGSAVTQPVSGAVGISGNVNCVQVTSPWVTSISGNVSVVQGGNLVTRIVGNSGNTLDCPSTQNTASPQAAVLGAGQFNSVPTTISNGNSSPLQLDSTANLLVNVKTGTVAATQSGNWAVRLQDGSGNAITSTSSAIDVNIKSGGGSGGTSSSFGAAFPSSGTAVGAKDSAGTSMAALNLDASGNLKVNVAAGGASGGTSSTVGAAVPGTATAAGFSDGTNLQVPRVFDADSGGGTQYLAGVLLKKPASGGGVDFGTSTDPIRIDPVGTTAQPVTGTFWQATQPISGTITANQGGAPWSIKPDGTVWSLTSTSANVNITNSVTVSGTVTANIGTSGSLALESGNLASTKTNTDNLSLGLGSTTSGQKGNLALGAVTTSAPTYTTAQTNALSLTTAGALRVDGSGATQPVSGTVAVTGTFWQATQPVSGTVTANQGGAPWTVNPGTAANWGIGSSTQNSASVANGHLQLAQFNTSPTTITSGNMSPMQMDSAGNLLVNIKSSVTQAVSQSGVWTVQPGNTANTTAWLVTGAGGTFPVTGTVTANQGSPPWSMMGDVASGSSDSGNPQKVGGQARTTNPTAVSDGQRVNAIFDKLGKQVVVGAIRERKGNQSTTITSSTAETTIVTAGAAGVFNDLYGLTIANSSATATSVTIKDATAGTTRQTLQVPAGDTRGFMLPVDSAITQAAAANNWTATCGTSVASITISALFVQNT